MVCCHSGTIKHSGGALLLQAPSGRDEDEFLASLDIDSLVAQHQQKNTAANATPLLAETGIVAVGNRQGQPSVGSNAARNASAAHGPTRGAPQSEFEQQRHGSMESTNAVDLCCHGVPFLSCAQRHAPVQLKVEGSPLCLPDGRRPFLSFQIVSRCSELPPPALSHDPTPIDTAAGVATAKVRTAKTTLQNDTNGDRAGLSICTRPSRSFSTSQTSFLMTASTLPRFQL